MSWVMICFKIQPQVRDFHHMLMLINHIMDSAPQWSTVADEVGLIEVHLGCAFWRLSFFQLHLRFPIHFFLLPIGLRRTSEGPVLEAESNHVEPRLPEPDTVSARNESIESRGIWNRDPSPTLLGGLISDRPFEAKDVDEMDSGSDVADSGNNVTSRESCPIQRNRQLVPSIRCAKDATSSRPLGRDTRYSLLELADLRSVSFCFWTLIAYSLLS